MVGLWLLYASSAMRYLLLTAFEDGYKWRNRLGLPFGSGAKNGFLTRTFTLKAFMTSPEAAACCKHTLKLQIWSRASLKPYSRPHSCFLKQAESWSHPFWALTTAISLVHLLEFATISSFHALDLISPTVLWLLHESNTCWQSCVKSHPFQKKAWWTSCLEKGSSGSPGSLQPITPTNASLILLPLTLK